MVSTFSNPVKLDAKYEEADLLVVGFNSTHGTIQEAKSRLEADGLKVNHAHVRQLLPFPTAMMQEQM